MTRERHPLAIHERKEEKELLKHPEIWLLFFRCISLPTKRDQIDCQNTQTNTLFDSILQLSLRENKSGCILFISFFEDSRILGAKPSELSRMYYKCSSKYSNLCISSAWGFILISITIFLSSSFLIFHQLFIIRLQKNLIVNLLFILLFIVYIANSIILMHSSWVLKNLLRTHQTQGLDTP